MKEKLEFIVREMNLSHIAQVADIEKACFSRPWSEGALLEALENPCSHFFAAESGGAVLGYIGMYCAADECYIDNIAVMPEYRRCGVGRSLLSYACDFSRDLGMSFISLEVRPSNEAAVSLYSKFGFERVGLRPGFYNEPKEDGLIMTLYFKGEG